MKYLWLSAFTLCLVGCNDSTPSVGVNGEPPAPRHPGEETYTKFCFSCHAAGIAGAPRIGEQEAWQPRIAKGRALLLKTTLEGLPPGMPPKGLCLQCSEEQLAAAIDYMLPGR